MAYLKFRSDSVVKTSNTGNWILVKFWVRTSYILVKRCPGDTRGRGIKQLTHCGRVTYTCVSSVTIIGSDNGLSPGRRQAIIWTNDGILLIGSLGTTSSEILIEINSFSFIKMHVKMPSRKWRPVCLGLNVLKAMVCIITQLSRILSTRTVRNRLHNLQSFIVVVKLITDDKSTAHSS